MEWVVQKFGGTSLGNAARYRSAAKIIQDIQAGHTGRQAVVVSAMSGVTNALLSLADRAAQRDAAYLTELRALRRKELEVVGELLDGEAGAHLVGNIERDFDDLEDLLKSGWILRECHPRSRDVISGYGEVWSAQRLALLLRSMEVDAAWLDARKVLQVEPAHLAPVVNWEVSRDNWSRWVTDEPASVVVVTGFIAVDPDGLATTLGRNGSDYSASIFGALSSANSICIWTDVDGVMSANPTKVSEARVLDALSYDEAMELAYFGAKVLHPKTMAPAVNHDIPIVIRNALNPTASGTRIDKVGDATDTIKGIASIDRMALVNLEGTSMIGVPGIAERLFGALRESGVSVAMISQASSEHSICFAIHEPDLDATKDAVERAFFRERHSGQIQRLDTVLDCSVVAVVGSNMAGQVGVAGRLFSALSRSGINVRAIAQGSSERNISVVVDTEDAERAVNAIHSGYYLSDQTISVGVIGPGTVGSAFLDQLAGARQRLLSESRLDLRVRAIANRTKLLTGERGIDLRHWRDAMAAVPTSGVDLDAMTAFVQSDAYPHTVIIDMSSSEDVAARYPEWIKRGIHIITPNKKAGSGPIDRYRRIQSGPAHFLYETTVGAALPVLHTLRDLRRTGDIVTGIEGILSGTMAYLFNAYDGTRPFSEIVREARDLGYTEPNPQDDLSGMDVARKVVILAREIGIELSLEDLSIESLVPDPLTGSPVDAFLDGLQTLDGAMEDRFRSAKNAGRVLRYVGTLHADGTAKVGLSAYPDTHPFARIALTDNIIEFKTHRYNKNPLVIQGPGAGPELTAGGVFADLLRLGAYVGGRAT